MSEPRKSELLQAEQPFEVVSEFQPTGDQPKAIKELLEGLERGDPHQTLLGATGTGKTFSMSNVIAQHGKPTIVLSHNKTLAAQLYAEFKQFFSEQRGRVLYFLLRLLSTGSLYRPLGYLHREGHVGQRAYRSSSIKSDQQPG